jgi:hypothetical protein
MMLPFSTPRVIAAASCAAIRAFDAESNASAIV